MSARRSSVTGIRSAARTLPLLLLLLSPRLARAQDSQPDLGWKGNAGLGFTLTEGNSQTSTLSTSANVIDREPRHKWTFSGSYVLSHADGDQTANKGSGLVQLDVFPDHRFFVFGKFSGGFNKPAGLDLRLAPGAGAGYTLVESDRASLSLEAGGNWIRDRFANDSTDQAFYGSAGENFSLEVSETTDLVQSLQFNPRAEDLSNYLLHGELTLNTKITELLGLQVSFLDDFDSTPFVDASGVRRKKNDVTFVTGLSFKF